MSILLTTLLCYYITVSGGGQALPPHRETEKAVQNVSNTGTQEQTERLVLIALMMGLIFAGTVLVRLPIPLTRGYVHLGDAMIYLAVILLGRRDGALAAGLGSALGDILGGFAFWAPWTLIIKALMALTAGTVLAAASGRRRLATEALGMILGGLVMCMGYLIVERCMYGSWGAALLSLPWNVGQFAVGAAVALPAARALYKTPLKRYFH